MKPSIFIFLLLASFSCTGNRWLAGFRKPAQNPVLAADSSYTFFCPVEQRAVRWQLADVFNPAAVIRNDSIFLLFRAEDNPAANIGGRTSRIGLAASADGLNFRKYEQPVLFPEPGEFQQWDYPGGCEDPRVVETDEGAYVMLYTSWNKETARLSAATSPDLKHWKKHGPVFEEAHGGRFLNHWSKSGSIVTRLENDKLIAARIGGKYWMYWGEQFVNLAWADNLLDWAPLLDETGELLSVMAPRPRKFDSFLTEPGPPALLTDKGILLFYNGKNDEGELADPSIPKGTYCGGQALFDKDKPQQLLRRMDKPFICPSLPHERTGQYQAGTTFIEGLVYFRGQWFLYYGTADSMVGVAVKKND